MKKIQMVDLKGQYEQIKDQVNLSVLETIESAMFINGPSVKSFQDHLEKIESHHLLYISYSILLVLNLRRKKDSNCLVQ